jgi:hypothetical protein
VHAVKALQSSDLAMTKWYRALIYLVISALVNPRRRTGFLWARLALPEFATPNPSPSPP